MLKHSLIFICFSLSVTTIFSQSKSYAEDSSAAQRLIAAKMESLKDVNITNYLQLFTDAGTIIVVYEKIGKIKGTRCVYRGKEITKFQTFKLSKKDKASYVAFIKRINKDTTISLSYWVDLSHAFTRITFAANTGKNIVKGHFTSDCAGLLEKSGMQGLYSIYRRLL